MGLLGKFKSLFGRPEKSMVAQRNKKRKPRYLSQKPALKWAKYDALRSKVRLTVRLPKSYVLKYKHVCKLMGISVSNLTLMHIKADIHKFEMGKLAQKVRVKAKI